MFQFCSLKIILILVMNTKIILPTEKFLKLNPLSLLTFHQNLIYFMNYSFYEVCGSTCGTSWSTITNDTDSPSLNLTGI